MGLKVIREYINFQLTCPSLSSFRLLIEDSSGGDLDLYLSLSPGDTEFCK